MTKRDRKVLSEYVRWVADVIGLRDWTFELLPSEALEDTDGGKTLASCATADGRRFAVIRFDRGFKDTSPTDQRDTVVHELVHCHLSNLQWQFENDLKVHLAPHVFMALNASFERNVELAVDALAGAIAKHLPLIQWPTKGNR